MIIISANKDLPITKKQFEKSIPAFIDKYYRLPYLKEDDVEIEIKNDDGEIELRPFRANKYIKEIFGSQDKFTKYLLNNDILKLDIVSKYTGIKPNRLHELLSEKAEDVNTSERRSVHVFFNNDYYYKLSKYSKQCINCTKRNKCGQEYWVDIVQCKNYKKNK